MAGIGREQPPESHRRLITNAVINIAHRSSVVINTRGSEENTIWLNLCAKARSLSLISSRREGGHPLRDLFLEEKDVFCTFSAIQREEVPQIPQNTIWLFPLLPQSVYFPYAWMRTGRQSTQIENWCFLCANKPNNRISIDTLFQELFFAILTTSDKAKYFVFSESVLFQKFWQCFFFFNVYGCLENRLSTIILTET